LKRALLCAALVFVASCGTTTGPIPAPPDGAVDVGPEAALAFQARTESFYQRLIRRRFNALETFNDRFLRSHFRTEEAFFDYYADLATALDEAHFERSRPERAFVIDFLFGTPTAALVQVRYRGGDDRPLRPNSVTLTRIDRWDWSEDNWWITPGAAWR
jgi:hypothetical protein